MLSVQVMSRTLRPRLEALPTYHKLNAFHVVFIVLACIISSAIAVWLLVDALRKRARGQSMDALEKGAELSTEKLPVTSFVVNLPGAPPMVYSSNAPRINPIPTTRPAGLRTSPYGSASTHRPQSSIQRLRLAAFSTPSTYQRMSSATVTEHEIIDYHLNQGTMPIAFSQIPLDSSRRGSGASVAFSVADSCFSVVDAEVKSASVSTLALPKLSAGPLVQKPAHTRLGSLSASIRPSIFSHGDHSTNQSRRRSIFNFGLSRKPFRRASAIPAPTAENQQVIRITSFVPLLPDELVLKQDGPETVTILQTFDDGWCIVARTNAGALEVGAVPEWVFGLEDGEDETFATMRPMRSTSLGVTVDVKLRESGKLSGERPRIISWSNF